jgi:hypothetical protein
MEEILEGVNRFQRILATITNDFNFWHILGRIKKQVKQKLNLWAVTKCQ